MNDGGGGKSEWKGANKPPFREASPLPNQIPLLVATCQLQFINLLFVCNDPTLKLKAVKASTDHQSASAGNDLTVALGLYP
jgi:hypothetical protein